MAVVLALPVDSQTCLELLWMVGDGSNNIDCNIATYFLHAQLETCKLAICGKMEIKLYLQQKYYRLTFVHLFATSRRYHHPIVRRSVRLSVCLVEKGCK